MATETTVPDWHPQNADKKFFTTSVMKGVNGQNSNIASQRNDLLPTAKLIKKRPKYTQEDYVNGILEQNRTILSRAITLIESNLPEHFLLSQEILTKLLPKTGKSVRIGITGVPGAGKSTFIEAFGSMLCKMGKKVAVLAIDPSSTISGGSILGDKTRMEQLCREKNAFIRPSASGGMLGGVARKTRETMLVCEAAGYDVILIETVGVGQSEVTVRDMCDLFLLVQLAAQGDELQGIKKGVIELADFILVNKADGSNLEKSKAKMAELKGVLHYLNSPTPSWQQRCDICSAMTGLGIDKAWNTIEEFVFETKKNDYFQKRRNLQKISWMKTVILDELTKNFYANKSVAKILPNIQTDIISGNKSVTIAIKDLLDTYFDSFSDVK